MSQPFVGGPVRFSSGGSGYGAAPNPRKPGYQAPGGGALEELEEGGGGMKRFISTKMVFVLAGALLLWMCCLVPLWNAHALLHDSNYQFWYGPWLPRTFIIACLVVIGLYVGAIFVFLRASQINSKEHGEQTIMHIVTMFLCILGLLFILFSFPISKASIVTYNNLLHSCDSSEQTTRLYEYSQVLHNIRAGHDCIDKYSVEECWGYEDVEPYTEFLKEMESDFRCSGFCYKPQALASVSTLQISQVPTLSSRGNHPVGARKNGTGADPRGRGSHGEFSSFLELISFGGRGDRDERSTGLRGPAASRRDGAFSSFIIPATQGRARGRVGRGQRSLSREALSLMSVDTSHARASSRQPAPAPAPAFWAPAPAPVPIYVPPPPQPKGYYIPMSPPHTTTPPVVIVVPPPPVAAPAPPPVHSQKIEDLPPPTLFSDANYQLSCEGMAARDMKNFVGDIGWLTYYQGICLVCIAIVTGLLKLLGYCFVGAVVGGK